MMGASRFATRTISMLDNISLPDSLISIGEYAFSECGNLKNIGFGNSLESIDRRAFTACGSLVEVTLPESVKSVGDRAFFGCTVLKKAVFEGGRPNLGQGVFDKTDSSFKIEYNAEHGDGWADFSLYDAGPARSGGPGGDSKISALVTAAVLATIGITILAWRINR